MMYRDPGDEDDGDRILLDLFGCVDDACLDCLPRRGFESTSARLVRCLDYAHTVNVTLPVDPGADAVVERAMARARPLTSRRIGPRAQRPLNEPCFPDRRSKP